jgi:hypothetical protein
MASTEKNTPQAPFIESGQLPPINDESFSWNGLSPGEALANHGHFQVSVSF